MSKNIIGWVINDKGEYQPIYEDATWEFIGTNEEGNDEYIIHQDNE